MAIFVHEENTRTCALMATILEAGDRTRSTEIEYPRFYIDRAHEILRQAYLKARGD